MQKGLAWVKIIIVLALTLLLSACSVKLTDFTLLTTQQADFSRMAEFQKGNRTGEGAHTLYIILFLPTQDQPMKEAINRAMGSVPGCVALADGAIYLQNYYWLLAAGAVRYVVEATPVIDPQRKTEPPSRYIVVAYDETKKEYAPQYVSEEEYNKTREQLLTGADVLDKF